MPLQSTGPISLSDIQGEFDGTAPISLSEYYGVHAALPTSGTIHLAADFYGLANLLVWSGNSGAQNVSLDTSGNLARCVNSATPAYGAWATVDSYGNWDSIYSDSGYVGIRFGSGTGYTNGISVRYESGNSEIGEVLFTPEGGFTGSSYGQYAYSDSYGSYTYRYGITTSGGLVRFYYYANGTYTYGSWVSLTYA